MFVRMCSSHLGCLWHLVHALSLVEFKSNERVFWLAVFWGRRGNGTLLLDWESWLKSDKGKMGMLGVVFLYKSPLQVW